VQDVNDVTADDFGLHLWRQEGGVVTPKSLGTSLWAGWFNTVANGAWVRRVKASADSEPGRH
jgi:hypothetical protein